MGVGQPRALKCARCKHRHQLRATGRTRPLPAAKRAVGGANVLMHQAQYSCGICGHQGWSRHAEMTRLLELVRAEEAKRVIAFAEKLRLEFGDKDDV